MAWWHKQAFDHIVRAWGEVKPVRRYFFGLLALGWVVALVLGWFGTKTFYSERLAAEEAHKKVQDERLKQKDDLLAEFREKSQSATPDEVASKIDDLQRKLEKESARSPKIESSKQRITNNNDGSITIQEDVVIIGEYLPNGLIVEVYSETIIKGWIKSHHTPYDLNSLPPGPSDNENVWSRMIPSPYGLYTITIITKSAEKAKFKYRFSAPRISNGTQ